MSLSKAKNTKKASAMKPSTDNSNECGSLTLIDATCPVCLSIMIEPVSMPCKHALCMPCFELNVSESNLACPLCRKRISVWVRRMTKLNKLINEALWRQIQENFQEEVKARMRGEDDTNNYLTSTLPPRNLSAPGEIKKEYKDQLEKLKEEEEKRKEEQDKASLLIATKLQEEEQKRLQRLQNERETLVSDDFEFARQLRSSQLNQAVSSIRARNAKTPQSRSSSSTHIRSPPVGPMDIYLGQVTPSTSRKSNILPLNQLSPVLGKNSGGQIREDSAKTPLSHHSRNKALKRKISNEFRIFSSHDVPPDVSSSTSSLTLSSPRPLKDITSQYSSESESEFDSEENIINSRKKVDPIINTSRDRQDVENSETKAESRQSPFKSTGMTMVPNEDDFTDEISLQELLSEVLDETEVDKNSMKKIVEEQRALEERLQQEKEDRIMALRLQKDFRKVDRTKGSEDEYCLRKSEKTPIQVLQSPSGASSSKVSKKRKPFASSSSTSKNTRTPQSRSRFRQTTLMENLAKKQRRL